jgi:polysaccharide export outer membrane protein
LQILVWKEPDASVPTAVVRPDGKITLPMIREVEVAGLTPAELEKTLTEKLSKFIRAADVTVIVKGISGQRIYLSGAVRREGPVILESAMTVLQAINIAGGLTDYAKKKKIYILRNENGRPVKLPFDYQAVINGDRPELNILLRPNDMIVVP